MDQKGGYRKGDRAVDPLPPPREQAAKPPKTGAGSGNLSPGAPHEARMPHEESMNQEPTAGRRRFIASASVAAAATLVPRHVLGGPGFVAPSDKVNVALIGAGGQGLHNARALFQERDCQVIAIADPAEDWDLRAFYYGGHAGRGPVRKEIERTYAAISR